MKKIAYPIINISELVLFLYVLLLLFVFNMTYYANTLLSDIPTEEPIPLPFSITLLSILGLGLICSLNFKYLIGNGLYRKVKKFIWSFLFSANLLSCILWLILSYPIGLSNSEQILLIVVILVSVILIVQIRKIRNEDK